MAALLINCIGQAKLNIVGTEAIRALLMEMATRRGSHTSEAGFGHLEPKRYIMAYLMGKDRGSILSRVLKEAGFSPKQGGFEECSPAQKSRLLR
jgi:hypothetical protein